MKTNVIYNMDCLIGMREIPDKSIDMILCDLPYGTTKNQWDKKIDLSLLWNQYERIIKDNGAIVLFSQMPFTAELVASNVKLFRYEWIWEKTECTGFLNAKKMPLKAHESILIFYKNLPTYNPQMTNGKPYKYKKDNISSSNYGNSTGTGLVENEGKRYPKSILTFKKDKGYHPTQKPVALLEYFIKTYTDKGEVVLDNCVGSGSTCVACINTDRKYIAYELDTDIFSIAEKRVIKHKLNTREEEV